MNDEYNFLSKPLTTSAFMQGMDFQAPKIDMYAGTGMQNPLTSIGSNAIDSYKIDPTIGTEKTGLFDNAGKMQGIGSLVSAGAGLANTLAMLPMLKEQRKSLEQNRKFAAEDQLARRTARSGFNSFKG
jgi:hypothetical protein